jgi:hypothetical protein
MSSEFTDSLQWQEFKEGLKHVTEWEAPMSDHSNCYTWRELEERWGMSSQELIGVVREHGLPIWLYLTISDEVLPPPLFIDFPIPLLIPEVAPPGASSLFLMFKPWESRLEFCCFLKQDVWFVEKSHSLRSYDHSLWLTPKEVCERWNTVCRQPKWEF